MAIVRPCSQGWTDSTPLGPEDLDPKARDALTWMHPLVLAGNWLVGSSAGGYGGSYRWTTDQPMVTATATYAPYLPAAGDSGAATPRMSPLPKVPSRSETRCSVL